MDGLAQPTESSNALRSTYVCSGITVLGLPARPLTKSLGKYFVSLCVDGKEEWERREIRTRASKVVWEKEEDAHEFKATPAASLKVTLLKTHSRGRSEEEVGAVMLPLSRWLEGLMVGQLVTSSTAYSQPILVQLSIEQKDATVPNSAIALQAPVETADADATAARLIPRISGLDAASAAVQEVGKVTEGVTDLAESLEKLLGKLDVFVTLMDQVSEIHPYVKISWTILSAVLKVATAQQKRDKKMKDLIEKMKNVYDFLCDAQDLRDDKARFGVMSRLALQTVDCANFISSCIRGTNFMTRLITQSVSNVDNKIDDYSKSFDDLLMDFRNGSQLRTEIVTNLIVEDITALAMTIDLDHIPYTAGAGYEPSRRCLGNTRKALLEKIDDWATSTADDTAKIFVLTGPAGTGKSTIAHTIAHQFSTMKRLGASFCFSTRASPGRYPVSLFRNIARDLADFHPTFKAALRTATKGSLNLCTTEDLQRQLENFILTPAQALAVNGTILIVVDALDESGDVGERLILLRLLLTRLDELPPGFRVLVTCRAEQEILELLRRSTDSTMLMHMPTLEEDPMLSRDLFTYIRHTLTDDWGAFPKGIDDDSCDALRYRAEGLFQWAFVACDYILGPIIGQTALARYNDVINGTQGQKGLDGLYKTILEQILTKNPAVLDSFKIIMGYVVVAVEPLSMRSLRALLAVFPQKLMAEPDEMLPFLGSLLSGVGEDTTPMRPLHSSFREMLQSSDRGGPYYIGDSGHHERLVVASLRLLQQRLHFNMGDLESSYVLNDDLRVSGRLQDKVTDDVLYACKHWGFHLWMTETAFRETSSEVRELVRHLLMENMLFWVEATSIAGASYYIMGCLNFAIEAISKMGDDVFAMAEDCIRFVQEVGPANHDSAAHVYLSALVWLPQESIIAQHYGPRYSSIARIASVPAENWPPEPWPRLKKLPPGHRTSVTSIAVSPDNRYILSGYSDNTIQMWDAATGEPISGPLTGHSSSVTSVAFSPDNRRIVSGSHDHTIRIWDAATLEGVGEPGRGHTHRVTSVAFSPDSRRIVSGSQDKTIRIWDAETGRAVGKPLRGHNSGISSIAFSSDHRRMVSGAWNNTLLIWDADTGEVVGDPLKGHTDGVTSVAFSPDSKRIASGSEDHTVRIWDAETGKVINGPLTGHGSRVTSVAFSPDNKRIASGSDDSTIRIWCAETGRALGDPLMGHRRGVTSVVFSPDNHRLVSASLDDTVRISSVEVNETMGGQLSGPSDYATSDHGRLVRSSDGVDTGSAEKRSTGNSVQTGSAAWPRHGGAHQQLSLSPNLEHRLRQPYPADSNGECRITFDFETGWIMGNGTDHLLWAPLDQLRRVYTPQCPVVIPGPMIHIDLSNFVHGARWTDCRLPRA